MKDKFYVDSYNSKGKTIYGEDIKIEMKDTFKDDNFDKASLILFRIDANKGINATPIHVTPLEKM